MEISFSSPWIIQVTTERVNEKILDNLNGNDGKIVLVVSIHYEQIYSFSLVRSHAARTLIITKISLVILKEEIWQ